MEKFLVCKRSFLGFFVLVIFSALSTYLKAEVFPGSYFLFSSIFLFLIIHFYGAKLASAVAPFLGAYMFYLWGNPYEATLLILETWFVGYFYSKEKRNLILWDILFLFVAAMPLCVWSGFFMEESGWLNTNLLTLKKAVNLLLNVLVANALLLLIESFQSAFNKKKVSLQEILFNLLVLFFLIPLITLLAYIGKDKLENVKKEIKTQINDTASSLTIQMNNLYYSHLAPLASVADKMKYTDEGLTKDIKSDLMLVQHSFPLFKVLYVTDQEGKVVARHSRYSFKSYKIKLKENGLQEINEKERPLFSDMPVAGFIFQKPMITLTVPAIENNRLKGHVTGAVRPMSFLATIHDSAKENMKVTLVDRHNTVIVSNDISQKPGRPLTYSTAEIFYRLPSGIKKESEISSIYEWMNSSYSQTINLSNEIPWKVHVSMPVGEFKKKLYEAYIWILCVALLSSGIALAISYLLSLWIQASLVTVANLTSNLPDKIKNKKKIYWPDMMIIEVANIIENFKNTETKLNNMFSEIQMAHQNLEYLARFDPLTNAYNRSYFMKIFQEVVDSAEASAKMAIFFIDLDRFKIVNDTLGHQAGDALLVDVSKRLKRLCKEQCILSRLGGDEFIILMPAFQDSIKVEQKAQEIINALSELYKTWGNDYYLTASIGISLYPHDSRDSQTLIKYADMAMYAAKSKGKNNYQFYHSSIKEQVIAKVEMENELRHAIKEKQLQLYYQPQVNIKTGEIFGVEALIRWNHPHFGFVSPASFIPIAEETGLIIEIGDWILQTACFDAKSWQEKGLASISVSVNISMKQFHHENLLNSIKKSLDQSGLSSSYLKLEITESLAMSQPEQITAKLFQIKKLGIELALDDFGTGHSSLNYLKNLPVDILKIDRSFVQEIVRDQKDTTIVKALIEVAHSLGMTVVAEGVETVEQQKKLKSIHCDYLQGFVFSKPLSGEELEDLLKKQSSLLTV